MMAKKDFVGRQRKSEYYFQELGDNFKKFESDYDVKQRKNLIKSLIPNDAPVNNLLEVGCGLGSISKSLVKLSKQLTVSDISGKMAMQVGKQLNCPWIQADACNLPLPDNMFDAVISSECVEHTKSPLSAVAEMARVLKPGGVLIITTPNRLWYPILIISQLMKVRNFEVNVIWVWPCQVTRFLRDNGFDLLSISGCHLFPWQIPGSKRVLPFFDRYGQFLYRIMINFGIVARKNDST